MAYIALYWGVMIIGYFAGSKLRDVKEKFDFLDSVMTVCISALVLLMGLRMGSNQEVIDNFGTIGVESLIITILLMIAGILSVTVARHFMGIDKYGRIKGDVVKEDVLLDEKANEEKSSNLLTYLIIIFVVVGIAAGYLLILPSGMNMEKFDSVSSTILTVGLSFMLMVIGFGMGLTGEIIDHLKSAGFRIFVIPLAIIIGTGIMAIICSLFLPISMRESLAVGYGYGWYTFAPIAITNAGHVVAGAVSFMHNVFRELGGIVLIPILAKKVGFIEVTSLPGVAAMDICMPIVERATRADILAYSFIVGMFESFMVPILVPLVIGG